MSYKRLPDPALKTPPFIDLLVFLEKNPMNTSERNICFHIDSSPKRVQSSLKFCVDKGLLDKSIHPKDARMRKYVITKKGRRVLGLFNELTRLLK